MNEKKMKKILALGVIVGVIIIGGISKKNKGNEEIRVEEIPTENVVEEFVEVKADGTKVNVSEELMKNKKVDGLEISNIRLVENGNLSQITADVKNTTAASASALYSIEPRTVDGGSNSQNGVRILVSLKSNVLLEQGTGDGSVNNPWKIVEK